MTPKAFQTLSKLRRAQLSHGSLIYVDFDDSVFVPFLSDDDSKIPPRRDKRIKFRGSPESMREIFAYLSDKGYIRYEDDPFQMYITVTHAGNNIVFEYLSAVVSFLFRSVLVPIAVSAATALVIHLIDDLLFPVTTSL